MAVHFRPGWLPFRRSHANIGTSAGVCRRGSCALRATGFRVERRRKQRKARLQDTPLEDAKGALHLSRRKTRGRRRHGERERARDRSEAHDLGRHICRRLHRAVEARNDAMRFARRFCRACSIARGLSGRGLDSGMGGMGGMAPPVTQGGGMGGGLPSNGRRRNARRKAGPSTGPNGQEQLAANPGATLAPNQAQYPVADGPTGMKCPTVTQFRPAVQLYVQLQRSGAVGREHRPKPTASPTPTPEPSASSDDDSDDSDASPTPTPAGGMTLQVEALPTDVPAMTNPNPRASRGAGRRHSPAEQHGFRPQWRRLGTVRSSADSVHRPHVCAAALQRNTFRGKRTDQYIAGYSKYTTPQSNSVNFTFTVPRGVSVRHTQIWLLAIYGATLPPGSTPTPSASPSPSPTSSAGSSPRP